ncbi:UNVERIFIED_CONTAM: hypothetical protein K2H54_018771 [Gekko kuhli]
MEEVLGRPELTVPPPHGRRDPKLWRLTTPCHRSPRAAGLMGQDAGYNPSHAHLPGSLHHTPAKPRRIPWRHGTTGEREGPARPPPPHEATATQGNCIDGATDWRRTPQLTLHPPKAATCAVAPALGRGSSNSKCLSLEAFLNT